MLRKNLLRTSKKCNAICFALTALDVRKLSFELADSLKIHHKFNKDVKCSGKDWMFYFLKCNPALSIRMSTATSIYRVKDFNKQADRHIFAIFKEILYSNRGNFLKVRNVEKTGFSNARKSLKVRTPKGILQEVKVSNALINAPHFSGCAGTNTVGQTTRFS